MAAYYNESDKFAAAWLRELIKAKLIADGEVDERSIELVRPDDLRGFVQCHFFAGIGGWSYALRLAGWPDDRECWTGSCPCQPWSVSGVRSGSDDSRHLWPTWKRLIEIVRPAVIFGEQVASEDGKYWCDLVCVDLEEMDYAFGAGVLPAAGVGAPEARHRLWFMAHTASSRQSQIVATIQDEAWRGAEFRREGARVARRLAHANGHGRKGIGGGQSSSHEAATDARQAIGGRRDVVGRLADADSAVTEYEQLQRSWRLVQLAEDPLAGFWKGADWLRCDDGKIRPVESGSFPLAHGLPARVGRLRGYGNAIVPQVAAEVIAAYMEICEPR